MTSENFILQFKIGDETICDELIEYHTHNTEYKNDRSGGGESNVKQSIDVQVLPTSKHPSIKKYVKYVMNGLKHYLDTYKHFQSDLTILESFNIQYYKPHGGFRKWHCERSNYQSHQRGLVFMTYLNTIDGGGTEFAYYPDVKINAEKGVTLIWPTDFTHTHRSVVTSNEKWIITGWYNHYDVGLIKQILGRI